jgi:hypothetical protein
LNSPIARARHMQEEYLLNVLFKGVGQRCVRLW